MEIVFLILLLLLMASALGSGFPVAFALPGSAVLTIGTAALAGYVFAGDTSAYFAQGSPSQWLSAGVTNFRGIYWEVERDTLIAIPLFVFMGIMLQRSKIAEDLLVTMAQLFGPIPGGLGISVVFVGALLAATTGIVGATVVAMGLISLPAMMRSNYSNPLATGTIAASGTLGQIIPPSIVLIILADQLASATDQASSARKALYKTATGEISMPSEFDVVSTSAGDMFMGALVPGVVLVLLYMVFILLTALLRPKLAPAVRFDGSYDSTFLLRVVVTLVPPLTLIFIVLGSIILGIATVNQAGAIGAVGATVMAGYRLYQGQKGAFRPAILAVLSVMALVILSNVWPINVKNIQGDGDRAALIATSVAVLMLLCSVIWSGWRTFVIDDTLRGVMVETAKTTSLVFIILLGAAMLTAAFRAFGGEDLVRDFLVQLPGGFWSQFVIVMAVIFVLGFFLDFIEISVVVVPIVAPILLADPSANITAVWLGVMIGLNIQTSFLTPPFGFALFYLRGVAPPSVRTTQMYKGVVAFIALQLIALVIVGLNPPLVNYLPNRISLTSDTAPPPINPKLQQCLETQVFALYDEQGEELRRAIQRIGELDLSTLPEEQAQELRSGFERAAKTFDLVAEVRAAKRGIDVQAPRYTPLHREVRFMEHQIAQLQNDLDRIRQRMDRLSRNPDAETGSVAVLKSKALALESQIDTLKAAIPSQWGETSKAFGLLASAEVKARRVYRSNVDQAYTPVAQMIELLEDAQPLAALEPSFAELRSTLASLSPEVAMQQLDALAARVGELEGTGHIRSRVSRARRDLRGDKPDFDKASRALEEGWERFGAETQWRVAASGALLPALREYELAIRDSIGLRQQRRLPRDQAIEIAQCTAVHRDLSLNF